MKPLYLLLILYAVLITALADGLEMGFMAIPGIGIVLGLVVSFCINITMGAGLILLLVSNGMFHPKFGPAGIVASMVPGLNSLPFWLALVGAGILQKVGEENEGKAGVLARLATSIASSSLTNPVAALEATNSIRKEAQGAPARRGTTGAQEAPSRSPLGLKSPRMPEGITPKTPLRDTPPQFRTSANNTTYVQKAA